MTVSIPILVQLSDEQMRTITFNYLSSLKKGEWVERTAGEGKLVLMHEVATSHKFDAPVREQDPIRIKFVHAVQEFEQALTQYEKATQK